MEEEMKELAELISKLGFISSQLDKIIDSPLISSESYAYGLLVSARFASVMAKYRLSDLYDEMKKGVMNGRNLS